MAYKKYDVTQTEYDGSLDSDLEDSITEALYPQSFANKAVSNTEYIGLDTQTKVEISIGAANTTVAGVKVKVSGKKSNEYFDKIFRYIIDTEFDYPIGESKDINCPEPEFEPKTIEVLHWDNTYKFNVTIDHERYYDHFNQVHMEFPTQNEVLLVEPEEDDLRSVAESWWYGLSKEEQIRYLNLKFEDVLTDFTVNPTDS